MFDIENDSGLIDILVGADVASRLFTGKRIVLSSGLVAIETYLGWTLMGKSNLLSEKEDTAMMNHRLKIVSILFTAYDDAFKEYVLLGIIEKNPVDSSSYLHEHYLPHRTVVKQHGTTKVRPVFDSSTRQVGSPSLN
ncbi:integrase catalytic domain-containing protein [Trichonephila clavipes]|nr:integrase catalytic domain-containing protein [Trichonephila clavipes]